MGGQTSQSGRPSIPPSLSDIKSEFEILCDAFGGPADIGASVDNEFMELMEQCCEDYPISQALPVCLRFQKKKDEVSARRHWPWMAIAISEYVFETEKRKKYKDEPTPTGVSGMLSRVAKLAKELRLTLLQLQRLADRLPDPAAENRRDHIAWLDTFLTQAVAGRRSDKVIEDGLGELLDYFEKIEVFRRLEAIEKAAKDANKHHLDKKLLQRKKGQSSNQALPNFIYRCGMIWKSLTGRKPSANRVTRGAKKGASCNKVDKGEPDFVLFVQALAEIGEAPVPSRKQVASVLGNMRTPD